MQARIDAQYQRVRYFGYHELWLQARSFLLFGDVPFPDDHQVSDVTRGTFGNIFVRTVAPQASADNGDQGEAFRLKGPPQETIKLEVEIDAASIDTGSPERDQHLRSADFLDVENFPTIRVTRGEEVLFHGTQLPIHAHLERLLQEVFARQEK